MQQPPFTPGPAGPPRPGDADDAAGDSAGTLDPLDALRNELASIHEQPVADRVARFEHANVVLAAALAGLDEV